MTTNDDDRLNLKSAGNQLRKLTDCSKNFYKAWIQTGFEFLLRKRSATMIETVERNSMHWGFKCRVAQLGHAPRPPQACVKCHYSNDLEKNRGEQSNKRSGARLKTES